MDLPLRAQVAAGLAVAPVGSVIPLLSTAPELTGVDLVAGGPPCQGFSMAGLRRVSDRRNSLPYDFLRAVEILQPRAVVMENVVGLGVAFSSSGKSVLHDLIEALRRVPDPGYVAQELVASRGWCGLWSSSASSSDSCHRARADVARRFLPEVRSSEDLDRYLTTDRWSSKSWELSPPLLAPHRERRAEQVTVREALVDLADDGYRTDVSGYPDAWEYAKSSRRSDHVKTPVRGARALFTPPNHELRKHSARVTARFALLQELQELGIGGAEVVLRRGESEDRWLAQRRFESLLEAKLGGRGRERAAPPRRSSRELATLLAQLATRKHSQRVMRSIFPRAHGPVAPRRLHSSFSRARSPFERWPEFSRFPIRSCSSERRPPAHCAVAEVPAVHPSG